MIRLVNLGIPPARSARAKIRPVCSRYLKLGSTSSANFFKRIICSSGKYRKG